MSVVVIIGEKTSKTLVRVSERKLGKLIDKKPPTLYKTDRKKPEDFGLHI